MLVLDELPLVLQKGLVLRYIAQQTHTSVRSPYRRGVVEKLDVGYLTIESATCRRSSGSMEATLTSRSLSWRGKMPSRSTARSATSRRLPSPPEHAPRPKQGAQTFVVQKHEASTLHYDFRLEVDGVLKSWAVRKGPSTDPAEKRLAMPTEDHPLAYASFEGIIPSGYGAGTVIVWDRGTYRNLREDEGLSMQKALNEGKAEVWLEGEKLCGGYSLVHMKGRDGWLLIKQQDAEADPERDVTSSEPASVLTDGLDDGALLYVAFM